VVHGPGAQGGAGQHRGDPSVRRIDDRSSSVSARPTTTLEHYRLAGAAARGRQRFERWPSSCRPSGIEDPGAAAQALVEGALLASYNYKTTDATPRSTSFRSGCRLPSVETHDEVTEGVRRGEIVASGVNWAKHLIDSPAWRHGAQGTRARHVAKRLENDPDVTVEVWTESRIKEERPRRSAGRRHRLGQPTRLVYATYDPRAASNWPTWRSSARA
jgi:leucyl aminopeptidase